MEREHKESGLGTSDGGNGKDSNAVNTMSGLAARLNLPLNEKDMFRLLRPDQAIFRSFQIFRHQLKVFSILAAVAWVPFVVLTSPFLLLLLFLMDDSPQYETPPWYFAVVGFGMNILFPMSTCISQVMSVRATAEIYAGKTPHWKRLLRLACRSASTRRMACYWGLLGFVWNFLMLLFIGGLVVLSVALNSGRVHWPQHEDIEELPDTLKTLLVCVHVCTVLCTTVLSLMYTVVVNPVMVLENKSIIAAIQRALELIGGPERGYILVALGLHVSTLFLLGLVPGGIIVIPFLVPPLTNILFTVIYFNVRIGKEELCLSGVLLEQPRFPATNDSTVATLVGVDEDVKMLVLV